MTHCRENTHTHTQMILPRFPAHTFMGYTKKQNFYSYVSSAAETGFKTLSIFKTYLRH